MVSIWYKYGINMVPICYQKGQILAPAVASLSSTMVPPVTLCGHALPQGRDTTLVASFEPAPQAERCKLREDTDTKYSLTRIPIGYPIPHKYSLTWLEYPLAINQFLSPYIHPSTCQKNPGCDTSSGIKRERFKMTRIFNVVSNFQKRVQLYILKYVCCLPFDDLF